MFRTLAPESQSKVSHLYNGVDTAYFEPVLDCSNPYGAGELSLVFTGAMDYWANVDAVTWFAREVFPKVIHVVPNARFYIVGGRPTTAVLALDHLNGVQVTGAVDDIRPYLRHAVAAVAPLRIARGLQNKVLEAMAMGKPVITTTAAMEGINAGVEFASLTADDPEHLADISIDVLQGRLGNGLGECGRDYIVTHHDWSATIKPLEAILKGKESS